MIVASSASAFTATFDSGIAGLTGICSVMVTDVDGNVVVAPSAANILELVDPDPTGVYVAARTAPGPTGNYLVVWSTDGTFDAETVAEEDMTVVTGAVTPVIPPIPVTPGLGPSSGPCTAWVSGAEVATCCGADVGSDTSVFDNAGAAASQLLFELSGRQFNGQCEETVRPCASGCGCWGNILWPLSPGAPQYPVGYGGFGWGFWSGLGWGWGFDGCESLCGCGTLSRAKLPGFPVTSIVQVLVDGVVLPETDPSTGALNWRLDEFRYLTRMAAADGQGQFWPSCQRLDLPDTEAGTWSITITNGQSPPYLGVIAAEQLACEIYKDCNGGACALPTGTVKVNRQGIEIERAPFLTWALQKGAWSTGLTLVDAFLSAFNPAGLRRSATVWDPDAQMFAERLGTGSGS